MDNKLLVDCGRCGFMEITTAQELHTPKAGKAVMESSNSYLKNMDGPQSKKDRGKTLEFVQFRLFKNLDYPIYCVHQRTLHFLQRK